MLLRSDPIACSNALEYADLLNIKTDRNKIEELLQFAEKYSGREMDILNLCAVGYLKIRNFDHAQVLFKWLVNEGYNIDVNSQILSLLYEWEATCQITDSAYRTLSLNYHTLESRAEGITLFPLPDKGASVDVLVALQKDTVQRQAEIVSNVYANIIAKLQSATNEKVNRILPLPMPPQTEEDADYYYSEAGTEDRMEQAKYWLSKEKNEEIYQEKLVDINITQQTLDIINPLYITVIRDLHVPADVTETLTRDIQTALGQAKDTFKTAIEILSNQQNPFTMSDYQQLCKIDIKMLTGDFFWHLKRWGTQEIQKSHSVTKIIQIENILYQFAKSNDLPFTLKRGSLVAASNLNRLHPFTPEMIGKEIADSAEKYQILDSMIRLIKEKRENIILKADNPASEVVFCVKGESEYDEYFNDALRRNMYNKDLKKNAIAVIYDHSRLFPSDLIFTPIFVKFISLRRAASFALYESVNISKDGKALQIGNKYFSNKSVVLTSLQKLIAELGDYRQKLSFTTLTAEQKALLSKELVLSMNSMKLAGLDEISNKVEEIISKF